MLNFSLFGPVFRFMEQIIEVYRLMVRKKPLIYNFILLLPWLVRWWKGMGGGLSASVRGNEESYAEQIIKLSNEIAKFLIR